MRGRRAHDARFNMKDVTGGALLSRPDAAAECRSGGASDRCAKSSEAKLLRLLLLGKFPGTSLAHQFPRHASVQGVRAYSRFPLR